MKSKILEIRVNSWLKNEKNRLIKEKITKRYMTFSENKPNFKNIKIDLNSFETSRYEILPAWRAKKQTQTNPKQSQFKHNPQKAKNERKFYYNKVLWNFSGLRGKKTNPIQTQYKPNFTPLPNLPGYHILWALTKNSKEKNI